MNTRQHEFTTQPPYLLNGLVDLLFVNAEKGGLRSISDSHYIAQLLYYTVCMYRK